MPKNKPNRGKLIIFEGPDGVGKSIISQRISEHLNANGETCKLISFPEREPGTLSALVYELHYDPLQHGVTTLVD